MHEFLVRQKLPTPRTWLSPGEVADAIEARYVSFPLLVKPRWGMGSIGIGIANSQGELDRAVVACKQKIQETYLQMMSQPDDDATVVIQECIVGPEYGADVFNDLQGNYICSTIKRKISQKPEHTECANTLQDEELHGICTRLASTLRHRGNLDVDIIKGPDGRAQVIEFNARFGGGYPFSHLAGAQFPPALIQMVRGEAVDPGHIINGVVGMLEIQPRKLPSTVLDQWPV